MPSLDRARALLDCLSEAMGATFIYCLCDPTTGEIRYVGKADDPKRRWLTHISCSRRQTSSSYNTYTARWIRALADKGLKPSASIIEWVLVEEWQEREQWWIDFLTSIGCRLVNTADGGIGGIGRVMRGRTVSAETRKKISDAKRGKTYGPRGPFSPEARENIRKGLLRAGVKPPPLAYQRALQVNRGRVAWNRGKKMSEETCRKLSAMRIGNTFTLGHKNSPEVKARKSAAQIRRRERERESRQS